MYANEIWAGDRWADGESVYPSRGVDLNIKYKPGLVPKWERVRLQNVTWAGLIPA